MHPTTRHPHPGFIHRPSTRLGWAAAATGAGALGGIGVFTAAIEQATDLALWQELIMFGLLLGLLAAFVMGVLAVFRRHERSWVVVVPTALIGVVIVNELVQGILGLFGLGGE